MQLVLGLILLSSVQGSLESYHLTINDIYLDSLYAQPLEDLQFPAFVETPAGSSSCLAGFRGGTSLLCPKKSWKLELSDSTAAGISHILLDAQYRDMSLMRNALGLLISRELGFPAPLTEHVEFYVNDIYYGVYVKVERIDRLFYERNGIGDGPLFKAVCHLGRFVWQPCDTSGTSGFDAKRGWSEELHLVRGLVDRVNLRQPLSFNLEDFISNAAISMCIRDEDAITKNYYLHMPPDSVWRYYPWDRDATFGNRWNGEYEPQWVEEHSMLCSGISPLLTTLLLEQQYSDMYQDYMIQTAQIMNDRLPVVIDSIYLEIRQSVYADTMKQGTNEDFDQAVTTLRNAIQERAAFIPQIAAPAIPVEVEFMTLSQWDFPVSGSSDTVTVTVEFQQPPGYTTGYWWTERGDIHYFPMDPVGASDEVWEGSVAFPDDLDNIKFSVVQHINTPSGFVEYYYPYYGFVTSPERRICTPTARRSAYPAHHDDLRVLRPIRYTYFLWALPLINDSDRILDLSFYGFQAGNPPARLFAPGDILIGPGDTLFLTNRSLLLEQMKPGSVIFGDLVLDSPSGSFLEVLDPSWTTVMEAGIEDEVIHGSGEGSVTVTEICFGGMAGDWIELFNSGYRSADLSGQILLDRGLHYSIVPDGVSLDPGCFLVLCESLDSWSGYYREDIDVIQALDFGLNAESDGIIMMRGDEQVFSVMYDDQSWPLEGELIWLNYPGLPLDDPFSWTGGDLPGTPGEPNPGWPGNYFHGPVISGLWPNPASSTISVEYMVTSPGEILVYDLAGRLVTEPRRLDAFEGTFTLELDGELSTGIYFLTVRAAGSSASSKFVLLR